MQHHQYADDLMLYLALTASQLGDLSPMSECVDDVTRWFLENALLLNPSKTDAVIFGTQQRLHVTDKPSSIDTAGFQVAFSDSVRLLGVTLDSTLSFNKHVTEVARSCRYHIRALRHIRSCLTVDTANQIACAIVGAKLDYCNSLLNSTSEHNLDVLQRVQNRLARAVLHVPWSVSATLCRRRLHWLPVRQRKLYTKPLCSYTILGSTTLLPT